MLALSLSVVLAQAPVAVAVIDISIPDAIYEDVSRGLADEVVEAMNGAGLSAERVDERDVPEGCRVGPCLGELAKERRANVVVLMDATEVDKTTNGVALAALWGRDGRPLATQRYTVPATGKKKPRELAAFVAELSKQARALMPARDGGAGSRP